MAREVAVTSYGVRCHLVLVSVEGEVYRLAVLACQDSSGNCIGLVLRRRHSSDESLPQYYVGASFWDGQPSPRSPNGVLERRKHRVHRLMTIRQDTLPILSMLNQVHVGRPGHPSGSFMASGGSGEIYILHRPPHVAHPWLRLYASEPRGFFVPDWVDIGPSRYGFQCTQKHRSSTNPTKPLRLTFWHPKRKESFDIDLGRCASVPLWATVAIHVPASMSVHVAAYTSATHPHGGQLEQSDRTAPPPPNPPLFSTPRYIPPHPPSLPVVLAPPPPNPLPFSSPQVFLPNSGLTKDSLAFLSPQVPATSDLQQRPTLGVACSTYHISTVLTALGTEIEPFN